MVSVSPTTTSVATVNPMTYILELARQGFVGDATWAARPVEAYSSAVRRDPGRLRPVLARDPTDAAAIDNVFTRYGANAGGPARNVSIVNTVVVPESRSSAEASRAPDERATVADGTGGTPIRPGGGPSPPRPRRSRGWRP